MGISFSSCCRAPATAAEATAKVILPHGGLREYAVPATASQVLEEEPMTAGCGFFLCNADDMDFDEFAWAVGDEEELEAGQIYFVLSESMLGRRLLAEDMAALAARASSGLTRCGEGVVVPAGGEPHAWERKVPAPAGSCGESGKGVERRRMRRRRKGMSGCRGRDFVADLSSIPE